MSITINHVSKYFDGAKRKRLQAVHNVTLSISTGAFFVLMGPSGCGKSTLLRIIAGLESPDSGLVAFDEKLEATDISFVFQQFALLPWLTVEENIAMGLNGIRMSYAKQRGLIHRELERFALHGFAKSYPDELSGGMKQRVGLARAFIRRPKLLLLDEPFSEVDTPTAQELRQDLLAFWKEAHPTIVMITHNTQEAVALADTIAVFSPRPGTVEHIFPVSLPRPRNPRAKDFFALEDKIERFVRP